MTEPTVMLSGADEEAGSTLVLRRQLYTQQLLETRYSASREQGPSLRDKLKSAATCSKRKSWKLLTSYLPVVKFAARYQIRKNLLGDCLSGLTVSFMHLPQAMGFGILASLSPVNGLYATFFPVLMYILFGTSPHISFGTNAVMALLTQTVVQREADSFIQSYVPGINASDTGPSDEEIFAVKVGASMACCLIAGLFLFGMGLFKLGFLTAYLSVTFVGGFTTAAAVHIASSQVPKVFGIKVKAFAGPGKLVLMYIDLFSKIEQIKAAEVIIAVICLATLLLVKICINERFKDKMKMPVPIDLIVVIIGTIISHFAKFNDNFNVSVVGPMPSGIPAPSVPPLENASNFIADSFVMAILSLMMSISMAKLTAKMHGITIDDSQELIAYGACNIMSSFFYCFPSATAPPRTMILSSLGAKTTLNGIPTAIFFLLVLLLIGPLFVSLPLSVLAAMIIVSMKDLLLQFRNLRRIWTINRYDFIIWTVTCAVSVFVDLDYGIIAGVGVSILLVVIQTQLVAGSLLGVVRKEDLILDVRKYDKVVEFEGAKIFRFPTSLYFATAEKFKNQIYREVLDPMKYKKQLQKMLDREANKGGSKTSVDGVENNQNSKAEMSNVGFTEPEDQKLRTIVLDCRVMTYLDMSGLGMLQQVIKEYKGINVSLYLAGCPRRFLQVLHKADFFDNFPEEHVFVDVFDAIQEFRGRATGDVTKL